MISKNIIERYNIPVPRYTSYPPANFFTSEFTGKEYEMAVVDSNIDTNSNISIYIHIPFCRHLCHYCGCNSLPITTKEIMGDYLVALKQELKMVVEKLSKGRKVSQIHYGGGSPTILPVEELKEINGYILSNFSTIENPEIAIECHPGYLDLEYWRGLVEAGFSRVSIGVQDFDSEVLKGVHRRASLERMEDIFEILRRNNITINLDLIYGLPGQSVESFQRSVERAIELSPDRIVTFSYAHVPWVNPAMLKLERLGLPEPGYKQQIFQRAQELLIGAGYCKLGLDHFVREDDELYRAYKGKILHRNFQGYCTRRTTGEVYGVGVSAISQLRGSYAQNLKGVKEYIEIISNGDLPVVKGYKLSEREQVVREFIGMLMCNEAVVWSELAVACRMEIDEIKAIIGYSDDMFCDMVQDGLITLDSSGLYMTQEGELFVRNVASRVDPLYVEGTKSYSKPI